MWEFSPSGELEGASFDRIMNKKAYITPAMEVINIETVDMMTASLGVNEDTVDTSVEGVQLGRGRRGTWGNLWDEGE